MDIANIGRYLILYSLEYDACFIADYNIVVEQVFDYAEPDTQNQKVLQTLRVGASFSRAYSGAEIWSTFDPHRFTDF